MRPLSGHDNVIWSVAISDRGVLASSGRNQGLLLWPNLGPEQISTGIRSGQVAFGPNGYMLTSHAAMLYLFRLENSVGRNRAGNPVPLKPLWQQNIQAAGEIFALAVSPDGQHLATGEDDGTIKIWTLGGKLAGKFQAHDARIWQIQFGPDGEKLVSASEDGTVKLWQRDGRLLQTLVQQRSVFWGAAFSPDGRTIAAASRDDLLHLWRLDATSERVLQAQTIQSQSRGLTRVAFSPDSQTVATGGIDTTVKLWNLDGTLKRTLPGHANLVTSLAYSPDGRYIAAGGDGGRLTVWDLDKIQTVNAIQYACDWVRDYLRTNREVADRQLCSGINPPAGAASPSGQ